MTRVCLYTRISTDEESQPTSLHSQRERLEAFCKAQEGWRIVAHEEDRSTGTKLDRPGINRALDLARAGKIDLLLVYRVDRLSRKVRQLAQLAEELDRLGVALRSATEPFDTGSAAGRMMLQMLGVFAEFEQATIVDRVSAGIERRANEGKWATGRLPFGYRRNEHKHVVPDERTAPTVRHIFELYASGRFGTAAIARQLADEQAPAPPSGWQPAIVQLILQNEAYLGRVLWRGESLPGLHEPLIDELTFQRTQRLLRERGQDMALRRSNPGDYLLSGLLRCGRCKRAYVGMSARGNGGLYHYYACSGRQKLGRKGCDGERIRRDKLETAVLHQLASLYRDGTLIRDALEAANAKAQEAQPALEEQRRALADENRRAERALARYYAAFEDGELDASRFEKRVSGLEARLDTLRDKDAEITQQLAPQAATSPDTAELAAVADNLETTIATAEPRQAKALLRLLIKDLRVKSRSEILPTYRVVTPAVCALPSSVERTGLELGDLRLGKPRSITALLAAAGVSPAVAACVAATRPNHAPTALGALDCVFPVVEEGGLAWRRCFGRRFAGDGLALQRGVRLRQAGSHLGRQDSDLLLVLGREELLAHPAEDVVDDRLRDSDVGVVRHPARLEAHVGELRDVDLERHAVLEAERDRDHERVHQARQRRALLGDVHEDVAGGAVLVEADVDVALVVADAELAADLDAVLR
jgi:site-specific DNA recombinase